MRDRIDILRIGGPFLKHFCPVTAILSLSKDEHLGDTNRLILAVQIVFRSAVLTICAGILALLALPVIAFGQTDKTGQPVVSRAISVTDAVGIALNNSPMIGAKRAATSAAIARFGMAKAMTGPQVSATGSATVGNMQMVMPGSPDVEPRNFLITPDKPQLDGNLVAMYPIYTGGKLQGQVKSAVALSQAATAETATTQQDVILGVRTAYYSVLLQCRMVDAQQQRITEATERVRIAQEMFDAGRIAKFDLLRNQTELAEAEQMLNAAQLDQTMALVDLKSMMGVSQTSQLQLTSDLTFRDSVPALDDLIASAVEHRSEVTAARSRISSAEADLSVARSAYRPQIYATAMGNAGVMADDRAGNGYLLGVTASIPVFDGGLRKSTVIEAAAMIDQMRADERQAVLTISKEVAAAHAQLCATSRNVTLAQAAITQAEEDYRVIKLRYEAGKATNVEVLDAFASLTRARTNYAQALFNYNVARDTLTRATGQLQTD